MRGELAPVIFPKFVLVTVVVGLLRFAWLKKLKNSPRAWSFIFSDTLKFLNRE